MGRATVVVIPPPVKHLAPATAAGNKDDRFDAYVLADTLRTDGHRLTPLHPDAPQTLALRAAVRARTDLVETRVALCNQLRAHLRTVFPGAVGLFADLDAPISLAFLARFPPPRPPPGCRIALGAWLAATATAAVPDRVLLARSRRPDGDGRRARPRRRPQTHGMRSLAPSASNHPLEARSPSSSPPPDA